MRPKTLSFTPFAADTDFLLAGATGAGPFTPTVAAPTDGLAHLVSVTTISNFTGITFTFTGLDADGKAQTDAFAGPNNGTATGTKFFSSITSVTASSTLGGNTADFGITGASISKTVPLNYIQQAFNVTHMVAVTGTIEYDVEYTEQDVFGLQPSTLVWFNHATLVAKTESADGVTVSPIRASRLAVNSVTGGATISYTILQGRG